MTTTKPIRRSAILSLPILFLSLSGAVAQQPGAASGVVSGQQNWFAETSSAPKQALAQLAGRGITLQYQGIHDLSRSPIGAPGAQGWFSRYSADITATIDAHSAAHWAGGTIFLHGKDHKELSGQAYSGVEQAYSNIDADSRLTLYEAWAQQGLFDGRLLARAGRIDANADFDVVATAADFLNASMGFSPTIMQFPSYPDPHFGAELSASPGKALRLSAAEFGGAAGGRMLIAEASRPWQPPGRSGRAALGAWTLRQPLTRFDGKPVPGTSGLYGVVEQTLWQRPLSAGSDKIQSLASYLQIGTGDGRENPMILHLGAGVVLAAPFRRRVADAAGAAATWVRFTAVPVCGFDAHSELALESYYKLRLHRTLSLVTDVQYFHHPGGTRAHPDSLMVTPRLVVTF